MNFGEVVSAFPGHKRTPSCIEEHFRSFYLGFNSNSIIWFAYKDDEPYFETTFNFDDIHKDDEDRIAFVEIIKPGLLPSCVFGKDQSATYEFYNPSVCARQLGFGQLPIGLYFSDMIKPREIIPSGTCYQRLSDRVPDSTTIDLDSCRFSGFCPPPFLMFGGQNGVITSSVSPQESTVSNWILITWRWLMRYSFYLFPLRIV
jgi:hypothetical protein